MISIKVEPEDTHIWKSSDNRTTLPEQHGNSSEDAGGLVTTADSPGYSILIEGSDKRMKEEEKNDEIQHIEGGEITLKVTVLEDIDSLAQGEEILSIVDRVEDGHQMDCGKDSY
ncbi:hypothetical protein HOLleu_24892 [Holothuria leucospilota]|uniref:Uncharacterized protein n=1 Tax=Holothuria leucospilota TaxID=206669 RepID=A0A9Q1BRB3_HOLLE|nr:hypothetical protein HOLleu_24892 [Holothuria leucospilota]